MSAMLKMQVEINEALKDLDVMSGKANGDITVECSWEQNVWTSEDDLVIQVDNRIDDNWYENIMDVVVPIVRDHTIGAFVRSHPGNDGSEDEMKIVIGFG